MFTEHNRQLSARECMKACFFAASSLPILRQFLSESFMGLTRCSDKLLDISWTPDFKIIGESTIYSVIR